MNNMKQLYVSLILGLLFLAGCTGTVYVSDNVTPTDGKIHGVVFYPPLLVTQIYETTVAIDKDGKVIADVLGSSGAKCTPIQTEKIVTMPDYAKPKRIYYDHGILETYTFGVTLDPSGLLTAVNTQSTPDQGKTFQNIGSTVGSIITAAKPATATPALACNDGSIVKDLKRTKLP